MDNEKSANGAVPPKLDVKKSATPEGAEAAPSAPAPGAGVPAAKKQTTRVDLSAAEPAEAKKKTSRIPLETALETEGKPLQVQTTPKTIRIRRPVVPPSVTPPSLQEEATPAAAEGKRKTSRIELEAALAVSGTAEEEKPAVPGPTPKTIRIKRPSQVGTIKLARPGIPEAPGGGEEISLKSQTSRIDLPTAAPAEATAPTQRKTIRIRRPESAPSARMPRTITIARPEEGVAEGEAVSVAERDVGVVFTIGAVAAVLVVCALIYVLAAQAVPDLGLAFPGKILS
jgi:hypothetical protein